MNELPQIAKEAARVRAVLEVSVHSFARKDRYSTGTDLRNRARDVARITILAWREKHRRLLRVRELSIAIDGLKLDMQLAKDIAAFRSDDEFAMVGRLITDLGKRCGGWLKELERESQNGQGRKSPAQRAPILSGRSASSLGANP